MFPPFHFSFSSPSGACNWVFYIILQTTSNKNFFFFEQGGLGNEPINNISRKYFQIPCTQCVINSYRFCSLELNCHFLREAALVVPILTHLSCPCGHPHYICELPWSHLTQFMIMNLCDYIIHQALRGQRTYPWYCLPNSKPHLDFSGILVSFPLAELKGSAIEMDFSLSFPNSLI